MNVTRSSLLTLLLLVAGLLATGAGAAEQAGTFRGEHADFPVPYYAGGVGYSPAEEAAERSRQYSVRVLFATPARSLLANVGLVVTDARGHEVFRIEGADPIIYLGLPAGRYEFEGRYRDGTRRFPRVTVDPDRRQDVVFVFPE